MKKKLLVVDDDTLYVEVLSQLFCAHDYDVVCGYCGSEGFNLAVQEKPDLIILDLMMPKVDGYQTYKMLKECDATKHIPIVMLTGISTLKEAWEDLYNEKYLCKPIEHQELLAAIQEALETSNNE